MSLGPITLSQSYAAKGFTMVTFQFQSRWVDYLKAGLGSGGEKGRPENRGNRERDRPRGG